MLRPRRWWSRAATSLLGLLDFVVPFAAVGVTHATAAASKASVQRHGHWERVEPVEKANAIKLAELHFDSPESAGYRHNAPLIKITQVQYWPRGGAGSTLMTVGRILRLSRGS